MPGEDLQAGLDDVKKFEDEMARQQEGTAPAQEQEKPKPVLTEEEKREADRKENERLGKLKENFLALIKDRSASLVQITDEKRLLELLELTDDYTEDQLERSLNAVDDLLSDGSLDYDRRMSIEKYLRNTADKLPKERSTEKGKEEEIDEATRLAKVKENFRRLIIDEKYDLFQITDNDKLAVLLCLPKNFTQKQLEDSLNVADDVLSDKTISSEKQLLPEERIAYEKRVYDRQRTAEQYLRNHKLKGREEEKPEDKTEEKPDGTYAIKFGQGERVDKIGPDEENPEEDYTPIPPERSLVRLEGGPLVIIEEGKPVEAPKEKILIADVSEVMKAMAWRMAENRLNEIVNNNRNATGDGRIKGFFKSQMARMGEKLYLSKFYYEALEDMKSNQDLMAEIRGRMLGKSEYVGSDPAKVEQWQILDQVVREMEEGVLESCEKGEDIENSGIIFADLINRHIVGEFADRGAFEAAAKTAIEAAISSGQIKKEQFATDKGRQGEAEGLMYASNLYEIAEAQRAKIEAKYENGEWSELSPEQKKTIAEHINATGNLDIRLATKLRDINEERPERPDQTRGYLRALDRIANGARAHPILGAIINPTTLGFASSMAVRNPARMAAMAGVGALGIATGFALPIVVGAGLGGVFAYARRRNALAHDRGLEQRREAIGEQGQGRRAERLRDFGFSGIGRSAESLLTDVNAGNADSVLEAAALFQAERELRDEGRPVDLITTEQETGEQFKTNYIPKTELKIAIRDQVASLDKDALDARVAAIRGQIAAQDSGFEKFRGKESWKAAAFGATVGAVAGAAAIEIKDYIQEHFMGQDTGVTMLEYLKGERPVIAHYEAGGQDLMPMDKLHHAVTMPDTGEKVDVDYRLGYDGHLMPVHTGLPEGYNFDPSGNLVHHVDGIEGGPVTAENWDHMRGMLESQHEGLLEQQHVSWSGFGYNENAPSGNSYTEFYIPRAEGTELQMDFIHNPDDSVTVSAARMLGHVAFSHGKEVKITPDMLDKLVATISPRDRVLQHEALVAHIHDGKITFPKDLAEKIFSLINGKVEPKPGVQITLDQVVHSGSGGQESLYSIAEEHAEGALNVPPVPPVDELVPPPADPSYIPPTQIVPPVAIPFDRRKAIGDVERDKKDGEQGAGEKEKKGEKGKFKIIDQKNKVVLWAADKAEEAEKAKLEALEGRKLEAVKALIASTPEETPKKPGSESPEVIKEDAESAKKVLDRTEIHSHEYLGEKLTKEKLGEMGLSPTHKVEVDGQNVYFSKVYNLEGQDGRVGVVAYVEEGEGDDKKYIARTYYRSNSQGVWRYLPSYLMDEDDNISWYNKSHGEEAITLPYQEQAALAKIMVDEPPADVDNSLLAFAGTARNISRRETDSVVLEVKKEAEKLEGSFYSIDGRKNSPESMEFTNPEQEPDFSKEPLATWKQPSPIYGEIESSTYPSRDGKLKYIFCRAVKEGKEKIWIGGIETEEEIGTTGVRKRWVDGGSITTPAYEYPDQAGAYANVEDRAGRYVDTYENYVSKIPIIRRFKAEVVDKPKIESEPAKVEVAAPISTSTKTPSIRERFRTLIGGR